MKNIILSIIGITMFTIIGCDNLPTEPISNGNENYSITVGQSNDDEVLNNDALPVSKDFIVNTKEYPLDSVLMCMNLTPEQRVKIDEWVRQYKNVQGNVKEGLPDAIEEYNQIFNDFMKSKNLNPKDSNYKSEIKKWNWWYNHDTKNIRKQFSDSLTNYKRMTYSKIDFTLTPEQRLMWEKWKKNPKLTCEFLKP